MSDKIMEIENLYFSYGKNPVLENVNLSLSKGDFLGIIGPNGGGKTTLIRIILGFLKPLKGRILVMGEEASLETAMRIGYVPQDVRHEEHFPITVREIVRTGRIAGKGIFAGYNKRDEEVAEDWLKRLELYEYADSCLCDLSGGQKQRVLIARALAGEPEILILDEPTSSVDAAIEKKFYDLLDELSKKIPVIMISHDVGVVSTHVNKIACLNRKLFYHDTNQLTDEMLRNVYHSPVDMVSHGITHRVLPEHKGKN